MELVITLNQLAWIIIVIVLVVVGIYAAIALKSLTRLVQQINEIMAKNTDDLNRIIPNITTISEDAVLITEDLRSTVGEGREKVTKLTQTADSVGTYAIIAGEAAKIIIELLSQRKKK
jgi:uncharacterized protein YoxC